MSGINDDGFGWFNSIVLLLALALVLLFAGIHALGAGCYFLQPAPDAGQLP